MSSFDDAQHPRGQAANAGQFRQKQNSAPAGGLSDVQLPQFTPEDVRNVDFTVDVISDRILEGDVFDLHESGSDADGNTLLEWKTRSRYGDTVMRDRLRINPDGEIIAVETFAAGPEAWFNQDPHGDELTAYRMRVNKVRLAMAGVHIHGQDNDGGPYGRKFVGGRVDDDHNYGFYDAAKVSKQIRSQIKDAISWGALPGDYRYRVNSRKYAGGQSIDITVEGMPDGAHYIEREPGYPHAESGHTREISEVLKTIGNQWNTDQSEAQVDYFDVTYYLHVSIEDERMAQFREQQREIAARKRAEKKASAA